MADMDDLTEMLISALSSPVRAKKKEALTQWEEAYFRSPQTLRITQISLVLQGGAKKRGSLVVAVGQGSWKSFALKKSAKIAIRLLCRLLDAEQNKCAQGFLEVFLNLPKDLYSSMKLEKHFRGAGDVDAATTLGHLLREHRPELKLSVYKLLQESPDATRSAAARASQSASASGGNFLGVQQTRTERRQSVAHEVEEANVKSKMSKIKVLLAGFLMQRSKPEELISKHIIQAGHLFGVPLADALRDGSRHGVPEFVYRCMEFLRKDYLCAQGLFRLSGDQSEILKLKQAANYGEWDSVDLSRWGPNEVAGVLKMYFREMQEPLFSYDRYQEFVRAQQTGDKAKVVALAASVPEPAQALIRAFLRFLADVSVYSELSKMSPNNLAIVFAPNVMRPKVETFMGVARDTPFCIGTIKVLIEHTVQAEGIVADEAYVQRARDRGMIGGAVGGGGNSGTPAPAPHAVPGLTRKSHMQLGGPGQLMGLGAAIQLRKTSTSGIPPPPQSARNAPNATGRPVAPPRSSLTPTAAKGADSMTFQLPSFDIGSARASLRSAGASVSSAASSTSGDASSGALSPASARAGLRRTSNSSAGTSASSSGAAAGGRSHAAQEAAYSNRHVGLTPTGQAPLGPAGAATGGPTSPAATLALLHARGSVRSLNSGSIGPGSSSGAISDAGDDGTASQASSTHSSAVASAGAGEAATSEPEAAAVSPAHSAAPAMPLVTPSIDEEPEDPGRMVAEEEEDSESEPDSSSDSDLDLTSQIEEAQDLPKPWVEYMDAASNKPYYFNLETSAMQWTKPTKASAAASEASAPAAVAADTPLPAGWEVHMDQTTGHEFFLNPATGESSWTRPASAEQRRSASSDGTTELALADSWRTGLGGGAYPTSLSWFANPQFLLKVEGSTKLEVSVRSKAAAAPGECESRQVGFSVIQLGTVGHEKVVRDGSLLALHEELGDRVMTNTDATPSPADEPHAVSRVVVLSQAIRAVIVCHRNVACDAEEKLEVVLKPVEGVSAAFSLQNLVPQGFAGWIPQTLEGSWDAETSGGCYPNFSSWRKNPMIRCRLTDAKAETRMVVAISRPDTGVAARDLPPMGVFVFDNAEAVSTQRKHQLAVPYEGDGSVQASEFESALAVSLAAKLLPGSHSQYTIMPTLFEPGNSGDWKLSVWTSHAVSLDALTPEERWTEHETAGAWEQETSGGCRNYDTWAENPQYLLADEVGGPVDEPVSLVLCQADEEALPAFGLYVLDQTGELVHKSRFAPAPEVVLEIDSGTQGGEPIIVTPCTFEPRVLKSFVLKVFSASGNARLHLCQ